ncbi:unnamed protein product [Arabidopsis halleri]
MEFLLFHFVFHEQGKRKDRKNVTHVRMAESFTTCPAIKKMRSYSNLVSAA